MHGVTRRNAAPSRRVFGPVAKPRILRSRTFRTSRAADLPAVLHPLALLNSLTLLRLPALLAVRSLLPMLYRRMPTPATST